MTCFPSYKTKISLLFLCFDLNYHRDMCYYAGTLSRVCSGSCVSVHCLCVYVKVIVFLLVRVAAYSRWGPGCISFGGDLPLSDAGTRGWVCRNEGGSDERRGNSQTMSNMRDKTHLPARSRSNTGCQLHALTSGLDHFTDRKQSTYLCSVSATGRKIF